MKRTLIILMILPLFIFESCGQKEKLIETITIELPICCITDSPNSKLIAVADDTEDLFGFQELNETYKIKILNSENYSIKYELIGHKESIESISFSLDSKRLVSTDKAGIILIWDLLNGEQLCKIETGEWVHNAKFSNSGNEIVAIQGYDKIALIYTVN